MTRIEPIAYAHEETRTAKHSYILRNNGTVEIIRRLLHSDRLVYASAHDWQTLPPRIISKFVCNL